MAQSPWAPTCTWGDLEEVPGSQCWTGTGLAVVSCGHMGNKPVDQGSLPFCNTAFQRNKMNLKKQNTSKEK